MTIFFRLIFGLCSLTAMVATAPAQVSFTTAIDLALRNSPKVLTAQADVNHAMASLRESHDVYIPNLIGGLGLAYSYGAPLGQPTLFTISSQSLLYYPSQREYIRAARAGLEAANLALKDARQAAEEDSAITYIALSQAQQRKAAMSEEYAFANRLVRIVQDRLDAGQDTQIELLRSRRTSAQIRLQELRLDDEITSYADHLARLTGLPVANLIPIPNSIPTVPHLDYSHGYVGAPDSPQVLATFANAQIKRHQYEGDKRYLLRPQLSFVAQYSRFSNINNYSTYYPAFNNNTLNAAAIGGQIQIPIFDRVHHDKVIESSADLFHAEEVARDTRDQFQEGLLKLQHITTELSARADLAQIDREIAQNQLDVVLLQLQSGVGGSAPQLNPKDEQNAHIQERQKFLDLMESDLQLSKTEINLLRQNGQLEDWLKSSAQSQSQSVPTSPPATN